MKFCKFCVYTCKLWQSLQTLFMVGREDVTEEFKHVSNRTSEKHTPLGACEIL